MEFRRKYSSFLSLAAYDSRGKASASHAPRELWRQAEYSALSSAESAQGTATLSRPATLARDRLDTRCNAQAAQRCFDLLLRAKHDGVAADEVRLAGLNRSDVEGGERLFRRRGLS